MFKKKDLTLVAVLLLVSLMIYLIIQFGIKKNGNKVIIKVDGCIKYELSINENKEITVAGYDGGENKITIKDGMVSMTEADCPDKLCVNMGKISKVGETIVCLPHRVVVEITGDEEGLDSVVQ